MTGLLSNLPQEMAKSICYAEEREKQSGPNTHIMVKEHDATLLENKMYYKMYSSRQAQSQETASI